MLRDSGNTSSFLILFDIFNKASFKSQPAFSGLNTSLAYPNGSLDLLFLSCFNTFSMSSSVQSGVIFFCASLIRLSQCCYLCNWCILRLLFMLWALSLSVYNSTVRFSNALLVVTRFPLASNFAVGGDCDMPFKCFFQFPSFLALTPPPSHDKPSHASWIIFALSSAQILASFVSTSLSFS